MVEGSRGGGGGERTVWYREVEGRGEDWRVVRRRGEGGRHVWYREVEGRGEDWRVVRRRGEEGVMDGGGK